MSLKPMSLLAGWTVLLKQERYTAQKIFFNLFSHQTDESATRQRGTRDHFL